MKAIAAGLLGLLSIATHAATLGVASLPSGFAAQLSSGAIQAQVQGGMLSSYYSHAGMSAYAFSRNGVAFALVQYDVLPGTQWDTGYSDATPQSGSVFVEAPVIYSAGDAAQFTLHLDQLMPGIPASAFWSGSSQARLELSSEAMAAGSGTYAFSGDPDYIVSGTMAWVDDGPFICIECTFFAEFNLVALDYSSGLLSFDSSDTRSYLFRGFDGYETQPYGWGLDVVVNPVPLPPALWLFGATLATLLPLRRRRQCGD